MKQSDGVTVTGRKQREAVEMRMEGDGEGDKAFRVAVCNESEAQLRAWMLQKVNLVVQRFIKWMQTLLQGEI